MKTRQSHKPRGKRKKGSLRFAEGKRNAAVGQTSRQAKQFASGIMGKYGFDRNNYLGMFALIFKGKGLLTDKELAGIKNPSDRAWILQLQLQLQSLKHPEAAPLITKRHTIEQIQKLVTQSGYRLPKQVLLEESQQENRSRSSEQMPIATEKTPKKRGRKSKKEKELASQLLASQENVHVAKAVDVKSVQAGINVVNKRNSPISGRSMRQLVASISMVAHSTSNKTNQPSPIVNDVQHTGLTTNIQKKSVQLLYKQALRDGNSLSPAFRNDASGNSAAKANHHSVAQHVDAIRNTSVWLEQFQTGKLELGRSEQASTGSRSSKQADLQKIPSILHVANLILQEATRSQMNHTMRSQSSLLDINHAVVPSNNLTDQQTVGMSNNVKLGGGPFSVESVPSTVRFIRGLLRKHVEGHEAEASERSRVDTTSSEAPAPASRNHASTARGFLASSQYPMAINAARLTSFLPRSMHATAGSAGTGRNGARESVISTTQVWRKPSEQAVTDVPGRTYQVPHEQELETTKVIQRLQQEHEELRQQASEASNPQVMEEQRIQQVQSEEQQSHQVLEKQVQEQVERQVQQQEEQQIEQQVQRQLLQAQEEVQRQEQQEVQQGQEQVQRQAEQHLQPQVQQDMQIQSLNSRVDEQLEFLASRQVEELVQRDVRYELDKHELQERQKEQEQNDVVLQQERNEQQKQQEQQKQVESREQEEQNVKQANDVQQGQVVGLSEPVVPSVIEQPVKRKRGRPRKNSGNIQESKELSNDSLAGSIGSLPTQIGALSPEELKAKAKTETDEVVKQAKTSSNRVTAAINDPEKVHRKHSVADKGRSTSQKIQSNESWLQQLVTLPRQSSSHDSIMRSANNVNQDGVQLVINRAVAHLSNKVIHPDLGTDVAARMKRMLNESKQSGATSVSLSSHTFANEIKLRASQQLHRQQTKPVVDNQGIHTPQEQLRSGTNGRQVDKRSKQQASQVNEGQTSRLGTAQQPTKMLDVEAVAKIAGASIRSMETLLATSRLANLVHTEGPEFVRLSRKTIRRSGAGLKGLTGHQGLGSIADTSRSSLPGRILNQPLPAEIAAKMAQSSVANAKLFNIANKNTLIYQQRGLQSPSVTQDGVRQLTTERAADRSMVLLTSSEVESSEEKTGKNRVASSGITNPTTSLKQDVVVSHSPLDMVRRAGSPSRVSRVREQQARIQRKMDAGQFAAKPVIPLSTSQTLFIAKSETNSRGERPSSAWMSGQLALRAGRVEDGTRTRRASTADQAQFSRSANGEEQGNQVHRTAVNEIDRRDGQSDVISQGQESVTGHLELQGSVNRVQRSGNDEQSDQQMPVHTNQNTKASVHVREVVRGERVQKATNSTTNRQLRWTSHSGDAQQLRDMRNMGRGNLVQRSLGISNGTRVRRANLGSSEQEIRATEANSQRNQVQQSIRDETGMNTGFVSRREAAIGIGQTSKSMSSQLVQRSVSSETKRQSRRADELMNNQTGQLTIESTNPVQRTRVTANGNLIQRASETRISRLLTGTSHGDSRQGSTQRMDEPATPSRRSLNWAGGEHLQRRSVSAGREREQMQGADGSESQLEAERIRLALAEPAISAMVSAQVEERAQALAPAAAARAAETEQGARSARAPRARQSTSMTPRVMPLLASPAGALRAAPAGTAAASPAAAEPQLPARRTGSLTLAAASGRAAAPAAGVQRTASMTNSSSQGWAAAALTKPLPTQVQRQVQAGAMPSSADTLVAPSQSMLMQSRAQQPASGAPSRGMSAVTVPLQSLIQPARQDQLASPAAMLEHKQAPSSLLSEEPLDMDWLRTKSSTDRDEIPTAPAEQVPPELSQEQLQELIKQLPQLDIAKIADRVYREIEKKMKFERQRRGI